MKLRHHTDWEVLPPLTDEEIGELDTKEITPLVDDDAALDNDMTEYAAFLKRLLEETGNE